MRSRCRLYPGAGAVLRQEWAARHMVEEAVLGWDQEFCYLQGGDKPLLGPVFVPMLRVGIIQVRSCCLASNALGA